MADGKLRVLFVSFCVPRSSSLVNSRKCHSIEAATCKLATLRLGRTRSRYLASSRTTSSLPFFSIRVCVQMTTPDFSLSSSVLPVKEHGGQGVDALSERRLLFSPGPGTKVVDVPFVHYRQVSVGSVTLVLCGSISFCMSDTADLWPAGKSCIVLSGSPVWLLDLRRLGSLWSF